ncbi:MAG TPA: hypothetical protein VNM87_02730 [Candidatus Udaeobacter sp.]|nr:hypothetical protein [Candidatus Udaeobacter sp.]
MERPLGITILAIVALVQGLFGLLGAFGIGAAGGMLAMLGGPVGVIAGFLGGIASFFLVIGPLFQLAFAWGAFQMQPWAWWLGIIGPAFTLIGALLKILGGASPGKVLMGVLIPLLIFLYLIQPSIRQLFRV